jgi:hypothetical protein
MFFAKRAVIDIYGAQDFHKIPAGYFCCETSSGKHTLGRCSALGLYWSVPTPAELTAKEIARLPVVHLCIARAEDGIIRIAGLVAVDTLRLDTFDGVF